MLFESDLAYIGPTQQFNVKPRFIIKLLTSTVTDGQIIRLNRAAVSIVTTTDIALCSRGKLSQNTLRERSIRTTALEKLNASPRNYCRLGNPSNMKSEPCPKANNGMGKMRNNASATDTQSISSTTGPASAAPVLAVVPALGGPSPAPPSSISSSSYISSSSSSSPSSSSLSVSSS